MGDRHRPAILRLRSGQVRDLGLEERHHSFDWVSIRKLLNPRLRTGLPRLPRTLPKRTETNERPLCCAASCTIISASRLVMPITLTGLTALSDEMSTKRPAPFCSKEKD